MSDKQQDAQEQRQAPPTHKLRVVYSAPPQPVDSTQPHTTHTTQGHGKVNIYPHWL